MNAERTTMGVAGHLRIRLDEYDARIRTFIPWYEEMLDAAADALRALDNPAARVVDLGTGTGALSAAAARVLPGLSVTALDEDAGILEMARSRLMTHRVRATFVSGSFVNAALPACDAVIASLALHHVRDAEEKERLYAAVRRAVAPAGLLVTADCHPSEHEALARRERLVWREHLRNTYSEAETDALFAAWAEEDTYMPLPAELDLIRRAGFAPHVVWRRGCFAVIAGTSV